MLLYNCSLALHINGSDYPTNNNAQPIILQRVRSSNPFVRKNFLGVDKYLGLNKNASPFFGASVCNQKIKALLKPKYHKSNFETVDEIF